MDSKANIEPRTAHLKLVKNKDCIANSINSGRVFKPAVPSVEDSVMHRFAAMCSIVKNSFWLGVDMIHYYLTSLAKTD